MSTPPEWEQFETFCQKYLLSAPPARKYPPVDPVFPTSQEISKKLDGSLKGNLRPYVHTPWSLQFGQPGCCIHSLFQRPQWAIEEINKKPYGVVNFLENCPIPFICLCRFFFEDDVLRFSNYFARFQIVLSQNGRNIISILGVNSIEELTKIFSEKTRFKIGIYYFQYFYGRIAKNFWKNANELLEIEIFAILPERHVKGNAWEQALNAEKIMFGFKLADEEYKCRIEVEGENMKDDVETLEIVNQALMMKRASEVDIKLVETNMTCLQAYVIDSMKNDADGTKMNDDESKSDDDKSKSYHDCAKNTHIKDSKKAVIKELGLEIVKF